MTDAANRTIDRLDADEVVETVGLGELLDGIDPGQIVDPAVVSGVIDRLEGVGDLSFAGSSDLDAAIDDLAADVAAANESRLMSSAAG